MPDMSLAVSVSRTALGLSALNINDHVNFYVSPTFMGGQVAWTRNQVTSPFIDGAVTTFRTRQPVIEQIAIEVLGDTNAEVKTNCDALVTAFIQDNYTISIVANGVSYRYQCEAADYQLLWTGPRFMAQQLQVVFAVTRQPVPLVGVA